MKFHRYLFQNVVLPTEIQDESGIFSHEIKNFTDINQINNKETTCFIFHLIGMKTKQSTHNLSKENNWKLKLTLTDTVQNKKVYTLSDNCFFSGKKMYNTSTNWI